MSSDQEMPTESTDNLSEVPPEVRQIKFGPWNFVVSLKDYKDLISCFRTMLIQEQVI